MAALQVRPLNDRETALLSECEETIAAGIMTFAEVGEALLVVRDQKLFRREYATFEDYCVAKWQISRSRAYQLMSAAELVSTFVDKGLPAPSSEALARALAAVPEDDQGTVWTTVVNGGEKPTAAAIRAAAEDLSSVSGRTGEVGRSSHENAVPTSPTEDAGLAGPVEEADARPASSRASSVEEPGRPTPPARPGSSNDFQLPDPDDLPADVDPAAVERYREKFAASQRADYLAAFTKAMAKAGKFLSFDAEQIATDPKQVESVRELLDSTQRFYDRMTARSGLRLVAGGKS